MIRKVKFIILLCIIVIVIFYLNTKVELNDPIFYKPKVNGVITRIFSIGFLSSIFYSVMAYSKRILHFFIGGFVGLISAIICYLGLSSYSDLTFHILGSVLFITLFFIIQKYDLLKTLKNTD